MRTWSRVLSGLVSVLLAVEAVYFIWLGLYFYRLFLSVEGGAAAGVAVIWRDGLIGLLLIVAAGAYVLNLGRLRLWAAALSPLLVAYGAYNWWSVRRVVGSLWSVFELDLFACGVASSLGFILIGVLAAACWWIGPRGGREIRR